MNGENPTLAYYNRNAEEFVSGTVGVDMRDARSRFCAALPEDALILDFGCGSGRDTKAFLEAGYRVEAVDGSELEVAVLERDGQLLISPPGEIRTSAPFYDYNAKYREKTTEFLLPAPLSLWDTAYVKQLAATVFRALGCRDYARVDFLRRADGKIFFNEINTLPGFTEDSLFPRLFALIGVDAVTFLTEGRL